MTKKKPPRCWNTNAAVRKEALSLSRIALRAKTPREEL